MVTENCKKIEPVVVSYIQKQIYHFFPEHGADTELVLLLCAMGSDDDDDDGGGGGNCVWSVVLSGSENDLMSVEHDLPLFLMNCDVAATDTVDTVTAVSSDSD